MAQIVIIAVIGLVGGVLSGLFGIGGGLVVVPGLVLLAGFPITTASGTSLGALLLPVGLFGALEYYRAGHVDIRSAAILAVGVAERSPLPVVSRCSAAGIRDGLPVDRIGARRQVRPDSPSTVIGRPFASSARTHERLGTMGVRTVARRWTIDPASDTIRAAAPVPLGSVPFPVRWSTVGST